MLENDLTIRAQLEKVPQMGANPDPADVGKLFLDLDELFSKLNDKSMSDQDKFVTLLGKLHPKFYGEIRSDKNWKRRAEDYAGLRSVVMEKAQEDWLERMLLQSKSGAKQSLKPSVEAETQPEKPAPPRFQRWGKRRQRRQRQGWKRRPWR